MRFQPVKLGRVGLSHDLMKGAVRPGITSVIILHPSGKILYIITSQVATCRQQIDHAFVGYIRSLPEI